MNSLPEGLGAYTHLSGLSALRAEARRADPRALEETAMQFESVFIHMLLKSMRAATPESTLFGGAGAGLYRDLFDLQMSQALAANRSFGIAELLVRQLAGHADSSAVSPASAADSNASIARVPPATATSTGPPPVTTGQRGRSGPDQGSRSAELPEPDKSLDADRAFVATSRVDSAERTAHFSSPQAFVEALHPHAFSAASALGVPPAVLLAQAALETGWGRSVIRHGDGHSSHNLFGIKADPGWAGPRARVSTLEVVDGTLTRVGAEFRSYDDVAGSFEDYVDFIGSNPRYRAALERTPDPTGYVRGLQSAGYATDPRYAEKILEIMGLPPLVGLKPMHPQPLQIEGIEPRTSSPRGH